MVELEEALEVRGSTFSNFLAGDDVVDFVATVVEDGLDVVDVFVVVVVDGESPTEDFLLRVLLLGTRHLF